MLDTAIVNRMYPEQLVAHYLLSSYCYYHLDTGTLTDHAFDRLCVRLLEVFDTLSPEKTKPISRADVEVGTCLLAPEDYPLIVQHAAYNYIHEIHNHTIMRRLESQLIPVTTH